ncbi:MAG: AAA family ATPase [Sedimentisphaerales bacterium]|jgi:predicted ATPase|nr:AAA family ATPase [Sedimentisphaerales bacterium]
MGSPIDRITLRGFKSIRNLEDFPLRNLNILIGPNGAGKSNFVSFFTFLREAMAGRLGLYVEKKGGADSHLFMGPKITEQIHAHLHFDVNGYEFYLQPTSEDTFVYADERILYDGDPPRTLPVDRSIGKGHKESKLKEQLGDVKNGSISGFIHRSVSSWVVYHFHDTSDTAPMRRFSSVRDYEYLRPDGANLAVFLHFLDQKHPEAYDMVRDAVNLAAPFFEDFKLRPKPANGDLMLQLEWAQKGSDYPFHVNQLSDGTLRFIALATALLQPNPPATMLFDEPELGLHPYALNLFAALVKKAATKTQIIVSTQSAPLLDNFEAEDIVVVERKEGESIFKRLSSVELAEWLKDYSLGELWQKNILGGRPTDG